MLYRTMYVVAQAHSSDLMKCKYLQKLQNIMTAPLVDVVMSIQNKPKECQVFVINNVRLTSAEFTIYHWNCKCVINNSFL